MASWTRWTWVWPSSGSWWWTGKPAVHAVAKSQTQVSDWTELIRLSESQLRLSTRHYLLPIDGTWALICFSTILCGCWNFCVVSCPASQLWFFASFLVISPLIHYTWEVGQSLAENLYHIFGFLLCGLFFSGILPINTTTTLAAPYSISPAPKNAVSVLTLFL